MILKAIGGLAGSVEAYWVVNRKVLSFNPALDAGSLGLILDSYFNNLSSHGTM